MSRRGDAVVDIAAGLREVLACPWVAVHAAEFEPPDWGPSVQLTAGGGGAGNADLLAGHDSGTLYLDGVGGFDEHALVASAPEAAWQAFVGSDAAQAGRWLAYRPTQGLVEAKHVDLQVVVPVAWADPATRGAGVDSQVERIVTVRAELARTAEVRAQLVQAVMARAEQAGMLLPTPPAPRRATPAPVGAHAAIGAVPGASVARVRGATR